MASLKTGSPDGADGTGIEPISTPSQREYTARSSGFTVSVYLQQLKPIPHKPASPGQRAVGHNGHE